jgi:hypothetical protein
MQRAAWCSTHNRKINDEYKAKFGTPLESHSLWEAGVPLGPSQDHERATTFVGLNMEFMWFGFAAYNLTKCEDLH